MVARPRKKIKIDKVPLNLEMITTRATPEDLIMLFFDPQKDEDEAVTQFAEYLESVTDCLIAVVPEGLLSGAKNMTLADLIDLREMLDELICHHAEKGHAPVEA